MLASDDYTVATLRTNIGFTQRTIYRLVSKDGSDPAQGPHTVRDRPLGQLPLQLCELLVAQPRQRGGTA